MTDDRRPGKKRNQVSGGPLQEGFAETTLEFAHPRKKGRKIRFGDVTVSAVELTDEEMKKRLAVGHEALKRLAPRLVRPGVSIPRRKGVPLYHVDDNDPNVIIRTLDGVVERGFFADGEFKKSA